MPAPHTILKIRVQFWDNRSRNAAAKAKALAAGKKGGLSMPTFNLKLSFWTDPDALHSKYGNCGEHVCPLSDPKDYEGRRKMNGSGISEAQLETLRNDEEIKFAGAIGPKGKKLNWNHVVTILNGDRLGIDLDGTTFVFKHRAMPVVSSDPKAPEKEWVWEAP